MRKEITVTAEPRETRGKNEARRLRVRGLAPAVLYGAARDAVAISLSPKEINKILHSNTGHNTIFNLSVQGLEDTPAMIVDWQNDPVRENLLHVDLKRIDLTQRIQVKVRVQTVGEPKGVKIQGGLLEVVNREIEIECLPDEIPDIYTIDVTELMIGQHFRASDIPLAGVGQTGEYAGSGDCARGRFEGGRGSCSGSRGCGCCDTCRAGSDQEGQEGRGRRGGSQARGRKGKKK